MIFNGETSSLVSSAYEVERAERALGVNTTISEVESKVLELRDADDDAAL